MKFQTKEQSQNGKKNRHLIFFPAASDISSQDTLSYLSLCNLRDPLSLQ